ncbi:ABC transporter permease [Salinimonas sp. HHU 13199]|uniref:ABC transporter permease n=1 Tax=Salinimonas profundi TaxID=2729140 RepID=A0ABR8LKI4_9ALTE|nr:ABC transporter permease [Salinimonas profundi]MBD3584817.1 ABC transporter permease [Salinimonas profundi]
MFSTALLVSRWLFIALLIVPVGAGIVAVLLPALSYFPAIGEHHFSLAAFSRLMQVDSIVHMAMLSLFTGLMATFIATVGTLSILAISYHTAMLGWVQRLLSPVLVIPHAAAAIALGFILSPAGWPARLVSPELSGWIAPPVVSLLHDELGLSVTIALAIKALPFMLLMALSVLAQPHLADRLQKQVCVARTMGYTPATAFLSVVWPVLYPLIRLPVLAVLAFATANVEIPLILGPGSPPTLAVAVLQWFNNVDIFMRLQASAAACLHIGVTGLAIIIWLLIEKGAAALFHRRRCTGARNFASWWLSVIAYFTLGTLILLMLCMLISLVTWSFATYWPFPDTFPLGITLIHWQTSLTALSQPALNALLIALPVSVIAVGLSLLVLEQEQISHRATVSPGLKKEAVLFLPLLVPGVAFLFGLTWFSQFIGAGVWLPVLVSHFVYVLPYVFLSLAVAYRRFDIRYTYVGYGLGASPYDVFWKVKLPQLFAPIMVALALGIAISFSQYLPTLLPGAGTIATVTTESVAVSAGGSRRLSAVYTLVQMIMPLIGFALAWWLPLRFFNPAAWSD